MKALYLLPIISMISLGMSAEHQHEHGESCADEHTHAEHVHSESCTDDHAHAEHVHSESCTDEHTHAEHVHGESCTDDHMHDAQDPMIIKLDAKARAIIALRTEPVAAAGDIISSSLYGYLSMPNYALQDYTMPAAGRVELKVKSAQEVEKGHLLFTVESPDIATAIIAQKELESSLIRTQSDIATMSERIAKLAAAGTRKSDLDEQLAFKKAEQAQLTRQIETSKQSLQLMSMGASIEERDGRFFLLVTAENAGIVRTVGVSQGSWGERGASIVSMSNEQAVEIIAQLYASDQPHFSHARAIIPSGKQNIPVEGSLRVAEQIDPEKQTRAVYFKPNEIPQGVQIGQLCRIDLFMPHEEGEHYISIPNSAIVRVGLDDIVFIQHDEGLYEGKKVHAGESRQGMTPVRGLSEGQQIVVKGAYEFKFVLPSVGEKKVSGHFHADGKFHEGEEH